MVTCSGVECSAVARDFVTEAGTFRVLRGVDFQAMPGKLTMLVGPSGCGKTTLISIIAGLLSASEGTVHVFGEELTALRSDQLLEFRLHRIGFVFQQYRCGEYGGSTGGGGLGLAESLEDSFGHAWRSWLGGSCR